MRKLAILLLLAAACRTPTAATLSSREVATIAPAEGGVSAKLIADPNAPSVQLVEGEEFVKPRLLGSNAMPVYPPDLVPLNLKPHTVVLRVTFDDLGQAVDIAESPVAESTQDASTPKFEAAARDALRTWRCFPARIRRFHPGPDNDGDGKADYRIMDFECTLRAFFDVSFSFEVVNGQPVVKQGN